MSIPPKRLRTAMENGFLNTRCQKREELIRAYGLWCWRMGLPMVWYEPRSQRSRLSRVHLDLFTTPAKLSLAGQGASIALSARYVPARFGSVSAYSATWDRVGPENVAEFVKAVFRTVRRPGHYELAARPARKASGPVLVPFSIDAMMAG